MEGKQRLSAKEIHTRNEAPKKKTHDFCPSHNNFTIAPFGDQGK